MKTLLLAGLLQVFGPPTMTDISELGGVWNSPAIADVNLDGLQDVVLLNSFLPMLQGSFIVLLQTTDGRFIPGIRQPIIGGGSLELGTTLTVGNLNNDYFPDVVISDTTCNLWIMLGKGDGTFQPPAQFKTGYSKASSLDFCYTNLLECHDFDGDGTSEIFFSCVSFGFTTGASHSALRVFKLFNTELIRVNSIIVGSVHKLAKFHNRGKISYALLAEAGATAIPDPKALWIWHPWEATYNQLLGPINFSCEPDSLTQISPNELFLAPAHGDQAYLFQYENNYSWNFQPVNLAMRANDRFIWAATLNEQLITYSITNNQPLLQLLSRENLTFYATQTTYLVGSDLAADARNVRLALMADYLRNDGNQDLLVLQNYAPQALALIKNLEHFKFGTRATRAPGQVELCAINGPPILGNTIFALKTFGQGTGLIAFNYVRLPEPLLASPYIIWVPSRELIAMPENILALPIPVDSALLNFPGYPNPSLFFQWLGSNGTCSNVLEIVVGPR